MPPENGGRKWRASEAEEELAGSRIEREEVQEEEQRRSLRFMASVRAARTEEKVGHSGRDDKKNKWRPYVGAEAPTPY